jgi:cell division protein FtsL
MSARSVTSHAYTGASRRSVVVARPRHRAGQWTIFFVLVLIAFFGLIYSRLSLDGSAFELDELQEQITIEQERQSLLQLEVARLQDPDRVAADAARLGLVYPQTRTDLAVSPVDERLHDVDARWAQSTSGVRAQP